MSFDAWTVFALFWVLFVTTPGPNAVNCIQNGLTYGFGRALWGVLAILTQASLFLGLSALGIGALITTAPEVFGAVRLAGAAVLVGLGVRAWRNAARPVTATAHAGSIYARALFIATFNVKSLAGYLAAFTQFVQPDVPIQSQMGVIVPTALTLTAASYTGYTAMGTWLGRRALGAVANLWVRRALAVCFILYGLALALYTPGAAT